MANNNKSNTTSKAFENSSSSQHAFSEQQHDACVLQTKIEQKIQINKQNKKIQNVQQASGQVAKKLESQRLARIVPKNNKNVKQKSKKRNNHNTNANDNQQNVKKQQRKTSAAPPQLATQSSKSNSSKSQKLQSNSQHAAPQQPNQSSRLYIGNLPLQLKQNQITKLFKKFGNLKSVKLVTNTTTGKSKGFGFVEYLQVKSAIKAKYQLSQHILDGLKIKIEFYKCQ